MNAARARRMQAAIWAACKALNELEAGMIGLAGGLIRDDETISGADVEALADALAKAHLMAERLSHHFGQMASALDCEDEFSRLIGPALAQAEALHGRPVVMRGAI